MKCIGFTCHSRSPCHRTEYLVAMSQHNITQTRGVQDSPHLHPDRPPLAVLKNLPDQSRGSHNSRLISDVSDVETPMAIRQMSWETTCDCCQHPSGKLRFVPPGTISENQIFRSLADMYDPIVAQAVSNMSLTSQLGERSVGKGQYPSSNAILIIWMDPGRVAACEVYLYL